MRPASAMKNAQTFEPSKPVPANSCMMSCAPLAKLQVGARQRGLATSRNHTSLKGPRRIAREYRNGLLCAPVRRHGMCKGGFDADRHFVLEAHVLDRIVDVSLKFFRKIVRVIQIECLEEFLVPDVVVVPDPAPVILLLRLGSAIFYRLVGDRRDRQNRNAARPKNTMDFAQRVEVVGNMLENMARIDEVKAGVVDIHVAYVQLDRTRLRIDVSGHHLTADAPERQCHRVRGELKASRVCKVDQLLRNQAVEDELL